MSKIIRKPSNRIDVKINNLFKQNTKREIAVKFALLLLIIAVYFTFISFRYGTKDGLLITFFTWSFFVLCTPIVGAGLLLDFPVRVLTKIRMLYSEMIVWFIAILANVLAFVFNQDMYKKTIILNLFHHILSQPIPFWGIIIISGIGTFLSVYFADELFDVSTEANRRKYHKHIGVYRTVIFIFLIVLILILYDFLLKQFGVTLPL